MNRDTAKIIAVVLCFVLYLGLLTQFFSKEVDTYVCYTTDTGECYHSATCQYIRQSRHETTVYEAERGYRSCSRCNPCTEKYETTITVRNYFFPLLISVPLSVTTYFLLVKSYKRR